MNGPAGTTPRAGLILLVLLSLGWGLAWPATKFVVGEIPPVTFRALNVPAAGISMMILMRLTGARLRVPPGRWPALLLAAMLNIGVFVLFMTLALRYIASGHGALLAYTMPLWAVVFGVFLLRERLTRRSVVALLLGLGGVLILVADQLGHFGAEPLGSALMLFGAMGWGLGTVVQKRVDWQMPATALAAWQLLIGGLPFIPIALAYESVDFATVSLEVWIAFAYSTWIPLTFCYYAWFTIIELFPVSVSAISVLAAPVIGVISGGLLLGERLGWREAVASVLVCSALAMVLMGQRKTGAPETARAEGS